MATRDYSIAFCALNLPTTGATATQIARLTGYTPQSVRRIMKEAVEWGLATATSEYYRPNVARTIYKPTKRFLNNVHLYRTLAERGKIAQDRAIRNRETDQ